MLIFLLLTIVGIQGQSDIDPDFNSTGRPSWMEPRNNPAESRNYYLSCWNQNTYTDYPTKNSPYIFIDNWNSYNSQSCEWKVRVPSNTVVNMIFYSFQMPTYFSCGKFKLYLDDQLLYYVNGDYFDSKKLTVKEVERAAYITMKMSYAYYWWCPYRTDYKIDLDLYFEPASILSSSPVSTTSSVPSSSPSTTTSTTTTTKVSTVSTTPSTTTTKGFAKQCGVPQSSSGRIVGGSETNPNELPYQALVKVGTFLCGGTLVGSKYVITAAHCTDTFTAASIQVKLGGHGMNSGTAYKVAKIYQHEDYASNTIDNDISLLELSEAVDTSATVYQACLANYSPEEVAGTMATVSGWGTTAYKASTSDVLRKVDIPVNSKAECASTYGNAITESMFCAGVKGKDSCQGDSGGPLTQRLGPNNAFTLLGVVSWGYECGIVPGVYTNIHHMKPWIESKCPDCMFVGKNGQV